MEKNIQEVPYKCLIFNKLFLKAHSSKPKMVRDSKNTCSLKVSRSNQNTINHVNNEAISIWKGILWLEIHIGIFQNSVYWLASKSPHCDFKCFVIWGHIFISLEFSFWLYYSLLSVSPRLFAPYLFSSKLNLLFLYSLDLSFASWTAPLTWEFLSFRLSNPLFLPST